MEANPRGTILDWVGLRWTLIEIWLFEPVPFRLSLGTPFSSLCIRQFRTSIDSMKLFILGDIAGAAGETPAARFRGCLLSWVPHKNWSGDHFFAVL
jgi:hypothetical protein